MAAEGVQLKAAGISTAVNILLDRLQEAHTPLQGLGYPDLQEHPRGLHNRLLVTRACMSRVSELTAQLIRLRFLAVSSVLDAEGELLEAEAAAVNDRPRSLLTEDYASAKERNARLSLTTLQELRAVRHAKTAQADVDSALDYARNRLWELDRAVRDIDTRLRILVFEPNAS